MKSHGYPQGRGITMDTTHPIRPVPALVTEPAMPPSHPVQVEPSRTVRRLVLRDHEGRMVDVEDHSATFAELDSRARGLMTWLRDTAPLPGASLEGRHHADSDQTTVIPRVEAQHG